MKLQLTAPGLMRHARCFIFTALGLTLCAAAKAQTAYQSVVLADNPLAYYALNPGTDGTSTAPDLTGNGNNGEAINISPAAGPSGYITNAANFDGAAAIDLSQGSNPNLLIFARPITIEAWAQPSNSTEYADIVAKGYDSSAPYPEIALGVNGVYGYNYWGEDALNNGELSGGSQTTNWSYLVFSSDGTNANLYQNGVLVAQEPDTNGSAVFGANGEDDWVIGNGSSGGGSRFFAGNISEVAIYNHGLTAARVLTHFYAGMVNASPSNSAPIIISQPQSQSVYNGGTAKFSVESVSAFPTTYQWYEGSAKLASQTGTTLEVTNVGPAQAGKYTVVASNVNGGTTSAVAVLTVSQTVLLWSTNNNTGVWDNGTTTNWLNVSNGALSVFSADDSVLFNDKPGEPTIVTIDTNVSPSLITVDSSTNAFTFGGSGAITGSGSLVKKGSTLLTITANGSFTGSVSIDGGVIYAGNDSFGSVSAISIANGTTLDLGGGSIPSDPSVTVSGFGFNGEGAISNSYANYPQETLNVTLAGDTLFDGSARWDFASGSQISGPHNLILDWSADQQNNYYSQWNTVSLGANVLGVFVTNGIDPSHASNLGMSYDSTICQIPETLFTVAGGCSMQFYNGGFNGSIHALSGSAVYLWSAPSPFNGSTITVESNAGWESWGSSSNTEPVNSAIVLNGVAHVVVGNHYMLYTNVISGPGGFVMDYYDHGMIFAAANTYTGPTIIGSDGNSIEVYLTNNGSISLSSLIFFGGTNASDEHMDVSERPDDTLTLASGQTLAGIGSVNGNLMVSSGATISPSGTNTTIGITTGANASGELEATGNVTLAGTTVIKLDGSSNDIVDAGETITYGGTLTLENISGTALAAGDSFQVFSAVSYSGSFASVTPATPGPGLAWDTTQLSSGMINVVASVTTGLKISSAEISSGNIVFSGTGGTAHGTYYVLTSTNLAAKNWIAIATNSYDASGNFVSTNALTPGAAQRFYVLKQ